MERFWKYHGGYWVLKKVMWENYKNEYNTSPPCPCCKKPVNDTTKKWVIYNLDDSSYEKIHECGTLLMVKY